MGARAAALRTGAVAGNKGRCAPRGATRSMDMPNAVGSQRVSAFRVDCFDEVCCSDCADLPAAGGAAASSAQERHSQKRAQRRRASAAEQPGECSSSGEENEAEDALPGHVTQRHSARHHLKRICGRAHQGPGFFTYPPTSSDSELSESDIE